MLKNARLKKILAIMIVFVGVAALISMAVFIFIAQDQTKTETETKTDVGDNTTYQSFFQKDSVEDIYITLSEEDWKDMLANPLNEEYKSATIKIGDTEVGNAGFRTKGNSSLRSVASSDSDRFSFRIKMDEFVEDQTLLGLDEFVVNNMFSDPTYMREYLSYEALSEIGEDVPLANYANIYINNELYGFYLMVEAVDDSFLNRNYSGDDGNLYRQDQGSTLLYQENSNYDSSEQKSGSDESKTDLKNFIKVLNEMPAGEKGEIESVLDVDSALRYIAANTVLGNYDSYSGSMAQNFYLYEQEGQFTVIPWDYNMSFGGFGGFGGGGQGGDQSSSQTTIPIDEPVMGANISNLPLISNLLAVPEYKEKYHDYIEDLLGYLENFEARVAAIAKIIRPYIKADPTKFTTLEQFDTTTTYVAESTAGNTVTDSDTQGNAPLNNPQNPTEGAPQGNDPMQGQRTRPSAEFGNGEPPEMPEGGMGRDRGNMGDNPDGRQGGGMGMTGNSISIVNFVRERMDNIMKQLSGDLPTTGNTTMNQTKGGR